MAGNSHAHSGCSSQGAGFSPTTGGTSEPIWLTKAEAAQYAHRSVGTVEGAIRRGDLQALNVPGYGRHIRPEWVDRWLGRRDVATPFAAPAPTGIEPDELAQRARLPRHSQTLGTGELTRWLVACGLAELQADGTLRATAYGREVGSSLAPFAGA